MFLINVLNLGRFKRDLHLSELYLDLGTAKYQLTDWLYRSSTSSMVPSIMEPLTFLQGQGLSYLRQLDSID